MNDEPAADSLRMERAGARDDLAGALSLAFSSAPVAERQSRVDQVLASSGDALANSLWAGYRGQRLVVAGLLEIQPGRTAVVSLPRVADGESRATAAAMLEHFVVVAGQSDVQLVQVLLETDHGPDAEMALAAGFRHVSDLLYLVALRTVFPTNEPRDGLAFEPYQPDDSGRLAKIISQTYIGSLDCPEIDGLRSIDDVLAGYRGSGVFDPARWLIVRHGGHDVGCLILTDHPAHHQWELVYMGVAPTARGRGYGVAIARYALWRAGQAARQQLVVAVDAANEPAKRMYAAAGFVTWDQRCVYLRVL